MLDLGIRFRHLHCFLTIAQLRSVGRAAEALAITQPALSKTLRELEQALQVRLFERGPRGMLLTSFGELFLRHAAASVSSLRHGISHVKAARSDGSAGLSVGALPNVAPRIIPAAVRRLRERFPALKVHVAGGTNGRLLERLRLGELDMVVGRLAQPEQMFDVTFEHLYSERLSLIVRRRHPLLSVRKLKPAMLRAYPWILPTEDTIIGHEIRRFLIDRGVAPPPGIVETTTTEFSRGYARASDAIWFAPRGAAAPDIDDGILAALAIDTATLAGPVGLTTRTGAILSPAALAMIDCIRETCRATAPAADNLTAMVVTRNVMGRRRRRSAR